jgi:hypothetical protein
MQCLRVGLLALLRHRFREIFGLLFYLCLTFSFNSLGHHRPVHRTQKKSQWVVKHFFLIYYESRFYKIIINSFR